MYAKEHLQENPEKPAFVMAETGETVSYADFEARSNQLAHYLRAQGLSQGDHFSILLENHPRFMESCGAGARLGTYYTCINSYLTASEVAYIVNNSESQILITSQKCRVIALEALKSCPNCRLCIIVDGPGAGDDIISLEEVVKDQPTTPLADERLGLAMLYSSGTTGEPKGILRPMPDEAPDFDIPVYQFLSKLWFCKKDMVLLIPAPLYHSAPNAIASLAIRAGATVIIMARFDPVNFLSYVERYQVTHTQMVPTMFSRLLKLPDEERNKCDVTSLEAVIHGAAPCPVQVKEAIISWWGPIVHEYYGATEGLGFAACDSHEWLAHQGSVGRILFGEVSIRDEDMQALPNGEAGTIWFRAGSEFEYFNDEARTKEAKSDNGEYSTVGDVGYLDDDNFLYLTDRATFMIVSGGVNIYPQESENLLITHPSVADAAVFGVPNEEFGEEVKAVVQLMPGKAADDEMAENLIEFCRQRLSAQKCPRSIDFEDELPRLPTGKLYKRILKDRYWGDRKSRIV